MKLINIQIYHRGKIYKLAIKATDLGLPPRSSTSYLSIRVNEVNDHPPKFEQSKYVTSLPENSLPGMIVLGIEILNVIELETQKCIVIQRNLLLFQAQRF